MAARLPPLLVLTDRRIAAGAGHSLPALVERLAGLDLAVVLREKDLPHAARAALGREVAAAALRGGVPLLVASSAELALELDAAGAHFAASEREDDAPASCGLVGRSCHTARELARASAEGADYATLSPVFLTPTKPGYGPALGIDGFARLVRGARLPVYALGGIVPGRAAACVEAGAHGVAVCGAAMAAREPAGILAGLLEELRGRRPQ